MVPISWKQPIFQKRKEVIRISKIFQIELLNTNKLKEWEDYVSFKRDCLIYHTLEWKDFQVSIFKYKTLYMISRNSKGNIEAVLPMCSIRSPFTGRRLVSLPFSQFCGPIWSSEDALVSLLKCVKKYLQKAGFDHLLIKMKKMLPSRVEKGLGLVKLTYFYESEIPFSGRTLQEVWRKFNKTSVRLAIKKAERENVQVTELQTNEELSQLSYLMSKSTKRHGLPPYPKDLFGRIHKNLVSKGMANIFLAKYRQKLIAGLVLFAYNAQAMPAYIFSDVDYLNKRPNNLLYWHAIKWSYENGSKVFDFGITSPYHLSLLNFKKRWGTSTYKIPYYLLSKNTTGQMILDPSRPKFRFATKFWKFVPISFCDMIGPKLLWHFG